MACPGRPHVLVRPCTYVAVIAVRGRLVCGWRAGFIFLFGRTVRIRCSHFFDVCTCGSELIVVRVRNISTNKKPSLSQKTLSMTTHTSAPWMFFLACRRPMMSFLWLSFRQWVVMMNPDFFACNYSWQKIISVYLTKLEKFCTDFIFFRTVLCSTHFAKTFL